MTEQNESEIVYELAVTPPFENRYFISVDGGNYINGMMIAFSQSQADGYAALSLTELTKEAFEAVGQDSQCIDGKILQGPPQVPELSAEAGQAILSARISAASEKIQTLQDAVSLGMATDTETAALPVWQKHRVLLSRVDISTPISEWPHEPEGQ